MEKIIRFIFLSFLFSHCTNSNKDIINNSSIRFDGIYVYDNKIDTFAMDRELHKKLEKAMLDTFHQFNPGYSSLVVGDYSRHVEYLKFFPDSHCVLVSASTRPDLEFGYSLIEKNDNDSSGDCFRFHYSGAGDVSLKMGTRGLFGSYRGKARQDTIDFMMYFGNTNYRYSKPKKRFIFYKYP